MMFSIVPGRLTFPTGICGLVSRAALPFTGSRLNEFEAVQALHNTFSDASCFIAATAAIRAQEAVLSCDWPASARIEISAPAIRNGSHANMT